MKSTLIFVLISLIIIDHICAMQLFFRGRRMDKHGMIRKPVSNLKKVKLPDSQWITQKLDHFNPTDTRVWSQRYFINNTFFKKGGPIFLQLGGEGTADPIWVVEGQISQNFAPKYNALIVLLEHRYYGKSQPTPDISVKNLQYLTSEQALADAAYFIQHLNISDSKWIVFGGSYSGSLSAWFRLKYPHLVSGAIASSAPVQAIVDFRDYVAVVRDSLGSSCDNAIRESTKELSKMLEHPLGWKSISKAFHLCDDLDGDNQNDVYNLMSSLAGNFEGVVQYNKDNREFEGAVGTNITIDTICSIMTDNSKGSAFERYASVNELLLKTYQQKCLDYKYNEFVKELRQTDWNSSAASGGRQWTYQTCVEFGFFQSSDLTDQPFGNFFPVKFFEKQCTDIFGSNFNITLLNAAVQFTNTNYGGFNINVRKVVFPNGSIDPWHKLGITKDLGPDVKAIYINGTAHCADMYPDAHDDPIQLKNARIKIVESIGSFLKDS